MVMSCAFRAVSLAVYIQKEKSGVVISCAACSEQCRLPFTGSSLSAEPSYDGKCARSGHLPSRFIAWCLQVSMVPRGLLLSAILLVASMESGHAVLPPAE